MSPSKKDKKNSFESSLKRLEEIVETLERGDIPLEDALTMYEEGIQLSKVCVEKLTQAELKLKKFLRQVDGKFKLQNEKTPE
ncbi:MAG: exodeoxyribonuclease VII small subunit [Bacteroidota bacterium]